MLYLWYNLWENVIENEMKSKSHPSLQLEFNIGHFNNCTSSRAIHLLLDSLRWKLVIFAWSRFYRTTILTQIGSYRLWSYILVISFVNKCFTIDISSRLQVSHMLFLVDKLIIVCVFSYAVETVDGATMLVRLSYIDLSVNHTM